MTSLNISCLRFPRTAFCRRWLARLPMGASNPAAAAICLKAQLPGVFKSSETTRLECLNQDGILLQKLLQLLRVVEVLHRESHLSLSYLACSDIFRMPMNESAQQSKFMPTYRNKKGPLLTSSTRMMDFTHEALQR